MIVNWVYGYFSGFNKTSSRSQQNVSIAPETVLAYMDKFCRDNPLKNNYNWYTLSA